MQRQWPNQAQQQSQVLQPNQDVRAKQPTQNPRQQDNRMRQARQPQQGYPLQPQPQNQLQFQPQFPRQHEQDNLQQSQFKAAGNRDQHLVTSTLVMTQPLALSQNQYGSHIWDTVMIKIDNPPTMADLRTDHTLMDQASQDQRSG